MSTPNSKRDSTSQGSANKLSKRYKGGGSAGGTPDKKVASRKFAANTLTMFFIHDPQLGPDGPACMVLLGNGYMERAITTPLYRRNDNSYYAKFVTNMAPYRLVVNPIHENGLPMVRQNKNRKTQEEPAEWPEKVLVFEVPNDTTEDQLIEFFNDTVVPNIKTLVHTDIFNRPPEPKLSSPPIIHLDCWNKIFKDQDIISIAQAFYCETETPVISFGDWIKKSKDNLYALWPAGKVPVENVIAFYGLSEQHLMNPDWINYQAYLKDLESTVSDLANDMNGEAHTVEE